MASQSLEAKDFSGGMTDNYIAATSNKFKEADNFYIADDKYLYTRPALVLADRNYARIPTSVRIGRMFVMDDYIVQLSDRGAYYKSATTFNEILGPSGNRAFDVSSPDAKFSMAKFNNRFFVTNDQFPSMVELSNDAGTWKARTLGLPQPTTAGVTISGTAGGPYSYVLQRKVSYTINGITYEALSQFSAIIPSAKAVGCTLSGLSTLTNTTTTNYDTVNVSLKIFRTQIGGSIFYKCGEINNSTTTFTDNVADGSLNKADVFDPTNISSDVTPTPSSKYIHQANDILWMAQPKVAGVVNKSVLRHSIRFEPWNCPGDYEEDFEAEITGISSINIYPIVFTKNSTFRVEGYYQANGSGSITKKRISDTVGCINSDSIVQTNDGVYFAADSGFYFTDGYKVTRISDSFNKTYRTYVQNVTQRSNIYGCYDQLNSRVMWTVQNVAENNYSDKLFIGHLKWGISENTPFTTWSGGKIDAQNFRPASILFYNDNVYVGDSRGYFLKFSSSDYVDDKIDTTVAVASWLTNTILYRYISPSYDFGTPTLRKWVTWLILNLDNVSSVSLQASIANDNSGLFKQFKEIQYKSNIAWGDPDIAWGDANIRWNYTPLIATKRRVPSANRCSYKQLMLENSLSLIDTSKRIGKCVIDKVAKTATVTGVWQVGVEDYYVSIPGISTTNTFKIKSRTNTVLVLEDLGNLLVNGTYDWSIYGYRRGEIIKLIEYSLIYTMTSMSQEPATVKST